MQTEEMPEETNGRHTIAIMDGTGDTKVTWDVRNEDEVEQARRTFNDLRKKGFLAFKVQGKDGSKGEQVTEFNPNEAMYILVPQYKGG